MLLSQQKFMQPLNFWQSATYSGKFTRWYKTEAAFNAARLANIATIQQGIERHKDDKPSTALEKANRKTAEQTQYFRGQWYTPEQFNTVVLTQITGLPAAARTGKPTGIFNVSSDAAQRFLDKAKAQGFNVVEAGNLASLSPSPQLQLAVDTAAPETRTSSFGSLMLPLLIAGAAYIFMRKK